MRRQKHNGRRGQGCCGWQHPKGDLGAPGGLPAFPALVLGSVVLPDLATDSAGTTAPSMARGPRR